MFHLVCDSWAFKCCRNYSIRTRCAFIHGSWTWPHCSSLDEKDHGRCLLTWLCLLFVIFLLKQYIGFVTIDYYNGITKNSPPTTAVRGTRPGMGSPRVPEVSDCNWRCSTTSSIWCVSVWAVDAVEFARKLSTGATPGRLQAQWLHNPRNVHLTGMQLIVT